MRGERIVRAGRLRRARRRGAPRVYDSLNERVFVLKLALEIDRASSTCSSAITTLSS
ncbi:MAG: hypothetical protein ACLSVD_15390 [Eggerthellaceae bacterium]